MQRTFVLALLFLAGGALAILVAVRGASVFSTPDAPSDDGDVANTVPSADETIARAPTFGDWPSPAAALVLTGEAHGYLEPCGCSENQSGGFARRSDLFRQIRDKGWPVAGLDLGGTLKRSRKQSEFKFSAITDALRLLDYRGLGLGPEELRLGPAYLISKHVMPADGTPGLSFLGANETFFAVPDLEGGPKKVTIAELGDVKIGAAMVLGESKQRGLYPEGAAADATFTSPSEALTEVVQQFEEAGTQLEVLLSYSSLDESRRLAEQFPQLDVVVSAGGPEDPGGTPEMIGDTLLVTVGHKGKYAGVLAFYPQNTEQPLRYELVDLNRKHFRHDPAMDEVMKEYQRTLADNLSDLFADMPEDFPPGDGEYVGAAKCGECHKKAYEKWKSTKHAQAYVSLESGRDHFEGTWVERIHDPECLSCHVTGWNPQETRPIMSGFLPEAIAAERGQPHRYELLKGQQCENCHGPGSQHVDVMARWLKNADSVPQTDVASARAAVKIDLATARDQLCIQCHDYENSPEFEFDSYWKEVNHTGLRD